jgi:two-component system LytT family response regulator
MVSAVIIDDEQFCIDDLEYLVKKMELPVHIVGTATSGKQGIEVIKTHRPELVFLDIVMPGLTGFEMLEHLDEINFNLIVITSVDKYAIQAIRASAIDFLIKPVIADELKSAIARIGIKRETPKAQQLNLLKEQLQQKSKINKIAISISDGVQLVSLEQIIYFKSEGNYTTVFLKNEKNILVSKQIGKFEEMLSNESFFRVHSSYLINLNYVSKYIRSDGGYVVMENGESISVARNRREAFLNVIGKV